MPSRLIDNVGLKAAVLISNSISVASGSILTSYSLTFELNRGSSSSYPSPVTVSVTFMLLRNAVFSLSTLITYVNGVLTPPTVAKI